jgi:DNA polymerase-3 subunit delta'
MRWGSIVGQDAAVSFLRAALSAGRLPGAVLLWGPAGVGKRSAGRSLAAAALCVSPPTGGAARRDEACGACGSCTEFAAGVHPDYLEPLIDDEARQIKLDTVRDLMLGMNRKPVRSGLKIALVPRAERLAEDLQNALLKNLEEPAGSSLWILTSEEPARLLATVRSRATQVRMGRIPRAVLAGALRAEGPLGGLSADELARLAEGSFTRARQLAGEDWAAELEFIDREVLPGVGAGAAGGPAMARAMIKHAGAKAARAADVDDAEESPAEVKRNILEEARRPAFRLLSALAERLRRKALSAAGAAEDAASWAGKLQVVLDSDTAIRHNVRLELVLSAAAARLSDAAGQ